MDRMANKGVEGSNLELASAGYHVLGEVECK